MQRGSLCRTLCAGLLAGTLALAPSTSAAEDPDPRVVVRRLEIVGDLGQGWQDQFQNGLEAGLARQAAQIVVSGDADCDVADAACWERFAGSRDAAFSVRGRVEKQGRDYQIRLDLLGPGGEVVASAEPLCELCGLAEVEALIEDTAGTLASRIDSLASANAVILFRSMPPGATLMLDGVDAGAMPVSREVAPGAHQAEAVLDGHVSQRRSFEAEAGVDETIRFELPAVPRDPKVLRRLGWASLGLGVAAVASGAVLIAIDENPITSRCSGDNVNSVGVCKFRRDTLAGGIALVASGGAAIVAGTVIAIVTRKRKKTPRTAVAPGGLALRF